MGEGNPYRASSLSSSGGGAGEAGMLKCPSCGAPCATDARACPHCAVELAAVRCRACFALHFQGAKFCARCAEPLSTEPPLDATNEPCPRCNRPLFGAGEDAPRAGTFECVGCGGLFVDHASFASMVSDSEKRLPPHAEHAHVAPASSPGNETRYLRCPVCAQVMNRTNFGRRSGVIVDVCRAHGTWFDAGELTTILEWVGRGGLAEARRIEAARVAEDARAKKSEREIARAAVAYEAHPDRASTAPSELAGLGDVAGAIWDFFKHHD